MHEEMHSLVEKDEPSPQSLTLVDEGQITPPTVVSVFSGDAAVSPVLTSILSGNATASNADAEPPLW